MIVEAFALLAALTPGEIMAKVAENQERALAARSEFVYHQNVLVRLHRGNGKLAREEESDFTVVPDAKGTRKERERFLGRYEHKGHMVEYREPHSARKGMDIDAELVSDMADDLTNDEQTTDGIAADLFPLTAARQKDCRFKLEGIEEYRGRQVLRVTFQGQWEGEVLVDTSEYQPVLITTRLAHGIPLAVKTLLGTNLRYVGFKVAYERFAEGVWFPVSYGGEFELRALFFYGRKVSMSLRNSGFQRADVNSRIAFQEP